MAETAAERAKRSPAQKAENRAPETGAALEGHYRFILWLVPTLEKFPHSQCFLLGDRIQRAALDVLESLIEATYTRQRRNHLSRANLGIEKLRFLLRLAHDLRHLDARRYEHAARSLDETGRRIGAWMKAHRARQSPRPV
ncbi:diversity-generating retroelement protein Avd [Candidatus Palauibacter sp.]|uniref:diversity-generating retroelement protein Avd n=1 Tax=Candidatus Palauibacter sp. TaxID=3101350 RepID=UPI003B01B816